MEVRLYVGNLPYETSDEELRGLFGQAGTVASVAVVKDRSTGNSKGFAFIEMTTEAETQKAISMYHGYTLHDRELNVNVARPREERSDSGNSVGAPPRSSTFPLTRQSGYQGTLGAFGKNGNPNKPRRRGGNQHY